MSVEPLRPAVRRGAGRVPPHNIEMEESLLGSMLLSRDAIRIAEGIVRADDFYKPAHGHIFDAVMELYNNGQPIDPVTVSNELRTRDQLDQLGGKQALLRLQSATPASANASHYMRIIVEHSSLRRIIHAAGDIAELAYDDSNDAESVLVRSQEMLSRAQMPIGGTPDLNVVDFATQEHEYEWAIPGLLEVMDRLLIVAPEKYGKSVLLRQLAVTISQGMHPFEFYPIPPVNVMLLDLENPAPLIRRKLVPLIDNCEHSLERLFEADRLRICSKPEGLDITKRADELWLQERVGANREFWRQAGWGDAPFVLVVGPIYQMLEDELDLKAVRQLQRALNRLRVRFRCTIVLETHAPHESFSQKAPARSLRPAGPRVWVRWPEFCRAIEPATEAGPGVADFYDVQGARDERAWPRRLRKGGHWPWTADQGV